MRGRCEQHELAPGPRGCLLCRREQADGASDPASAAAAVTPDPSAGGSAPAAGEATATSRPVNAQLPRAVLLVPLLAAGLYLFFTYEWVASAGLSPEPNRAFQTSAERPAPPATAPPGALSGPRQPTPRSLPPLVIEELDAPEARPLQGNARGRSAAAPSDERGGIAAADATLVRHEQQRRELAALREQVDVVVYYTSWCPACRKLRSYLAERGIRATEYDVEHDRAAQRRQRQLNPRGSVPTVEIEGQVLVGFNPRGLEAAIDRAARARLQRL